MTLSAPFEITVRPGHPDFLDLPWDTSIVDWEVPHRVDLPKGTSRHQVRFFDYTQGIYVVKELSRRAARQDYNVLRWLESIGASAVRPVGVVEGRHPDSDAEQSAALITAYEPFSFSYRELLAGPGFGFRRNQLLDAFAGLLVELHLAGMFWGDCSLSNVLYRYDAEAIETLLVDAETSELYTETGLSNGRRQEDLEIMIENVAGGMADIAAEAGLDLDSADLTLGEEIADRYQALWAELTSEDTIAPDERYRIGERIERLNHLGFQVEEVDVTPVDPGSTRLKLRLRVGGRTFHSNRLRQLTGIEALENQARQILTDLFYHQAGKPDTGPIEKQVAALKWRVGTFEPMLDLLKSVEGVIDPIQCYCDVLHQRYLLSLDAGHDVGTDAAYEDWLTNGRPGYAL